MDTSSILISIVSTAIILIAIFLFYRRLYREEQYHFEFNPDIDEEATLEELETLVGFLNNALRESNLGVKLVIVPDNEEEQENDNRIAYT